TFARYREAKVKLFRLAAANGKGHRTGIINADDPNAAYFAAAVPRVLRYGVNQAQADLKASHVKTAATGSEYDLRYEGQTVHMKVALPGSFNVYNSMAAAGVGLAIGLDEAEVARGVAALKGVPGRMNAVELGQDFAAIVDFA